MQLPVRGEIGCALLFDHPYPPVAAANILAYLSANFPADGFVLDAAGAYDQEMLLRGGGPVFIQLSLNRKPLPFDCFRLALHSPYQQGLAPSIDQAVADHTGNLSILVTDEPPLPGGVAGLRASLLSAPAAERMIILCQRIAAFLAERMQPRALHWWQSDQMMTPQQFRANVAEAAFPAPLHIHPHLFSSGNSPGARRSIGFRTFGARHVIGREILFTETTAALPWMYGRALAFVQAVRRDGYRLVPDGQSFSAAADEVIAVRHRPADEDAIPLIELSVVKSAEHGIGQEPAYREQDPARPVFGRRRPR